MTLAELQRRMGSAIMQPLTPSGNIARRTAQGGTMREEAAGYIRPNDRLTSLERLQIYSRQYWYRVLDSLYEDFPGLRAILGGREFERLAAAYLAECPSRSFTLRDLGSGLEDWLRRNPRYAGRRLELSLDMVRLEWAHIVAFDGEARKALGPEDLLEPGPGLRLSLQPYISLLELKYPVDDIRASVNATLEEHGAASNAVVEHKHRSGRGTARLKPRTIHCAVHRWDFAVYFRRLTVEEYRLLRALRDGGTIGEAIDAAFDDSALAVDEIRERLRAWFAVWSELGWFYN